MADKIVVNTNTLASDADNFENHIEAANARLESMKQNIDELNTMWKGQANEAFKQQFMIDYADMKEIINKCRKYKNLLSSAVTEYNKCDSQVNSLVNRIKIF